MKKVNEAFERLRDVMPDLSLILQDEKDTKVSCVLADFSDQNLADFHCLILLIFGYLFKDI